MRKVCLVVPVLNEAEAIPHFVAAASAELTKLEGIELEFLFVNDGSTDATLQVLLDAQLVDARIRVVDLSRNFGKEAALTAGIDAADADAVIPMDVDLQDPLEAAGRMILKWQEGYEVVLGRRVDRDSDGWAKRASANSFYRVHNQLAKPKIPENVGDFRLMDRCVVDALRKLPETHRFMKGLFAWVGFKTAVVDYARPERVAGQTKFNGWKLWNLAVEGITSSSTVPLRLWTYLGAVVALCSFLFGAVVLFRVLLFGVDVPGYASLYVAVTFLGGLQLVGIGVLGEYLGRTYVESKRRPVYVIRKVFSAADAAQGGGQRSNAADSDAAA